MQLTRENLQAIAAGLNMTFNTAFKETETQWQKLAMKVSSGSAQNTYAWLSKFPKMREWIGDKVVHKLSSQGYTIPNKSYESTVEVLRDDIEDDNIGQYSNMVQQATWSGAQLPDEMVAALLNDGDTNLCYDGKPFFSSEHPIIVNGKQGKASNLGTAKLSVASEEAIEASYGKARNAMRNLKDEDGRALKVRPTLLVVPPSLESVAKKLLTSSKLADGKDNIYKDTAELVVLDDLDDDNAWYLLDQHMPVKPLIIQERKKLTFVQQTDINSPDVFSRGVYKYGVEARYGAGYSFWQLAYKSTGTA